MCNGSDLTWPKDVLGGRKGDRSKSFDPSVQTELRYNGHGSFVGKPSSNN